MHKVYDLTYRLVLSLEVACTTPELPYMAPCRYWVELHFQCRHEPYVMYKYSKNNNIRCNWQSITSITCFGMSDVETGCVDLIKVSSFIKTLLQSLQQVQIRVLRRPG